MELSEAPLLDKVIPGYKKTEVGVIPADWEVYSIQELLDKKMLLGHLDGNHGALYPRSSEFVSHGIPYITANDFITGRVSFDECKFLAEWRAEQFVKGVAKDGDVLFAHNATVGPVALLRTDWSYVILSTTATYFRCDNSRLVNEYLIHAFRSSYFTTQYKAVMSQSTRNQVPITTQRKLNVVVPAAIEQRAIARALSDVDGLLGSLDALIAKKKAIKQGAMQRLLTGKQRLKGFEGEWVVKRLGEVAAVTKGEQLGRSSSAPNGNYPHLNGGMTPSGFSESWNTEANTIAISEGGNSCGYVQFMTTRYWNGGHCYSVRPSGLDNRFLYHMLKGNEPAIMALRVGSGLPNVQKTALLELQLTVPSSATEQTAIAEVLSDMDAEIGALEARRAKTALLKQGMMQELLTGRTRFV